MFARYSSLQHIGGLYWISDNLGQETGQVWGPME